MDIISFTLLLPLALAYPTTSKVAGFPNLPTDFDVHAYVEIHKKWLNSSDLESSRNFPRADQPPGKYYPCLNVYTFLKTLGATKLWDQNSGQDCCGFDASVPGYPRYLSCQKPGPSDPLNTLRKLVWTGELKGDLSENLGLDQVYGVYTTLDLSQNSDLTSTSLPRWFLNLGNVRELNMSNTAISSTLPPVMDLAFGNLTSIDFSSTKINGAIPPLGNSVKTCKFNSNPSLCYYTSGRTLPQGCNQGVGECAAPNNVAPIIPKPPAFPPLLDNAATPVQTPQTAELSRQCGILKTWFVAHGFPQEKLWSDAKTCCPYWRETDQGPNPQTVPSNIWVPAEVNCMNWGITTIAVNNKNMSGDPSTPDLSSLTALARVDLRQNRFTKFPDWATKLASINSFSVANNSVVGNVPNLLQIPDLQYFDVSGNQMTGPIPQIVNRKGSTMGSCDLNKNGVCWQYDTFFYDTTCADTGRNIEYCPGVVPPLPTPIVSTGTSQSTPTATQFTPTSIIPIPTGTSDWKCIQSCPDKANYILTRTINSQIQCAGPNSTACTWFINSACTLLAPGEQPVAQDQGMICTVQTGWCGIAAGVVNGTPVPQCTSGIVKPTNTPSLSFGFKTRVSFLFVSLASLI